MRGKYLSVSLMVLALFYFSCDEDSDNDNQIEWPDFTLGEATNLGPVVNSADNESSPTSSSDGLELYFGSDRAGGYGGGDLWVTTRATTDDDWGIPVNLGPVVNDTSSAATPSISSDGLTLYFSDWGKPRPGGQGSVDIWMTTRTSKAEPWSEPVNLGPVVNGSGFEVTPEISSDGLELYFESERHGGYGLDDLYVSSRLSVDDTWGTPLNLGAALNDTLWEHCPTISSDGLILFYDLHFAPIANLVVTRRETKNDVWEDVEKLGNIHSDHYAADVSADFTILYFTSSQAGGQGGSDIWQLPLEPK